MGLAPQDYMHTANFLVLTIHIVQQSSLSKVHVGFVEDVYVMATTCAFGELPLEHNAHRSDSPVILDRNDFIIIII